MSNDSMSASKKTEINWARFRFILFLGVLIISIVGSMLLSNYRDRGHLQDPKMHVLSVASNYSRSVEIAEAWHSDAILTNVEAWFKPEDSPEKLSVSYTFRSTSNPSTWLIVWVYSEDGVISIRSEDGEYPTTRPLGEPIKLLELPLDSSAALELIMENGGNDFISRHPQILWPLSMSLRYEELFQAQGPLVWIGNFLEFSTRDSINIAIDAYTGELLQID
jgi:hypothetical protein